MAHLVIPCSSYSYLHHQLWFLHNGCLHKLAKAFKESQKQKPQSCYELVEVHHTSGGSSWSHVDHRSGSGGSRGSVFSSLHLHCHGGLPGSVHLPGSGGYS